MTISEDVARIRSALPPLGVRVRVEAVAQSVGLDPDVVVRRLAILCAAGEATLSHGWVERRIPVAREQAEERGPSRFNESTWTPMGPRAGKP